MIYTDKKNIYLMLSCFFLFIFIAVISNENKLTSLDQNLITWIISSTPSYGVLVMEWITKVGSAEAIIIISLFISLLLLYQKMYSHILLLFSLTFGGIALNFFLKVLFQRQRPGDVHIIEVFGYSLEIISYSFPSGHTMRMVILISFLIYLCQYLIKRTIAKMYVILTLVLFILTVSLSRVVVGAHFPSDVIAAIAISVSWFYFCLIVQRYFQFKYRRLRSLKNM